VDGGRSAAIAQDVSRTCSPPERQPAKIVEKKGLAQVSDTGAIENLREAIAANPGPPRISSGQVAALNFSERPGDEAQQRQANPEACGGES